MKGFWLIFVALVLVGAAVWFFHVSGTFLADRDYLAGLLHILVGATTLRAGVQVARLAVVVSLRAP